MENVETNSSLKTKSPTVEEIFEKIALKYKEQNPEKFEKISKEYSEWNNTISLWEFIWNELASEIRSANYQKALSFFEESKLGNEYEKLFQAKIILENNIPPSSLAEWPIKELYTEIKDRIKEISEK